MSTTAQLRTVATTMTGREMAEASRKTAAEAGSATVKKFFEANRGTLEALLPKHFDSERMLKLALGALRTTPKLAGASLSSLLGSVVTCAQLGLEPNTPLGHAYLLPFEKREKRGGEWVTVETQVQVIIGYKGLIDLALRSGQIVSIAAHEVCANDHFEMVYGLDEKLEHKPGLADRGPVIGFYAVAKLVGGGHAFEFMPMRDVEEIRDNSQGWQQAVKFKKQDSHPWGAHFVEMGRKTVIRRLAKYLPLSIEFQTAATLDGMAEAGKDQGLDTLDGEFSIVPPDDMSGMGNGDDVGDQQQQGEQPQQTAAIEHQQSQAIPQPSGEPTIEDAMASVREGDFEMASDIARNLMPDQAAEVKAAITKAQQTKRQRAPMSIE